MRIWSLLGLLIAVAATVVSLRKIALHQASAMHHNHAMRHEDVPASSPVADLGATHPLNQPGAGPVPAEAYAVYSALYQEPAQEPLAFSDMSFTDIPQVGESCLKPATAEQRELVNAFVAGNQQSHRWERAFSIPQGYTLLQAAEVAHVQTCLATHGQHAAACERYEGLKHVRLLGVPGFNHRRTRALVSVIKSCGSFCGSGGIFAVEKSGNTWRRSPTTGFTRDCSWVY